MDEQDRWVKLYNTDGVHVLDVQLTEEGYKDYLGGEDWNPEWVELMIDVRRIKLAEF
jgi:hypothetical protein